MGLRFILGRAGAGKTHACLEAVRAASLAAPEGPPLVLLVPEQATFQMEQALLGKGGLKGIMRAQVLSFQRLAWRVSQKAGGLQHPPLSEVGKAMVLRALLQRRQPDLRLFGQVADRPGFIAKLSATISELRTFKQTSADLRRRLAGLEAQGQQESTLGTKLHDLALMMQELTEYTSGRFTDPDDYLPVLAERLPASGVLDGAEVWVDAFTGFTPQELSVMRAILQTARQVHLTLCLDPADLKGPSVRQRDPAAELFHPTLTTHEQLLELAAEAGVEVGSALYLPGDGGHQPARHAVLPRFASAPDLGWVERQLFRALPAAWYDEPPEHIALVHAQSRREEAEAAAGEVLRLVRDEGLRYRQISVVARNLDAYGDLVSTVFREHGIPAFVDQRRTVAHHPLVELVRSALEVVIQNWSYHAVFRYLKTDLAGVDRGEADLLENYVIEHGIRGEAWYGASPWTFLRQYTLEEETLPSVGSQMMLERINRIRARATAELAAFHRRISGGRGRRATPLTARSISTALFHLLDDLKVARRLERWSEESSLAGDLEVAREHEQVWGMLLDLLDQMVEALGDTPLTLADYLQVLSAGLDGLRLGLIPPGMDMAVVGSVERSRHSGVRATLILGATERDFPPMPPEDVIFTDREREQLKEAKLEIGPTSIDRLFQEQFFTYVALTRGGERLWLSYPLADESGRAVAPSQVIRRLMQVFPALRPVPASAVGAAGTPASSPAAAIATPGRFAAALTEALRLHRAGYPLDPVWLDLYQWAATDPGLRSLVAPTLAALRYEESFARGAAPLGPDLARSLYGSTLVTSVSRLEAFAACPFLHFAGHGLRLKERARFEVAAPQLGLFYHAALSLFVRDLQREGRDWSTLTPEESTLRLDGLIDQLAPRLQSEILLSTPQHRYLLRVMRRTLQGSLRFLTDHVRYGDFRPLWVELPFGEEAEGSLPSVDVPLTEGRLVRLRGRIDRVDGLQTPDGSWLLRVMDYKSSPRPLDLGKFYHGLALQLLLYLYAVVRGAGTLLGETARRPAGAIYFPVHDPVERLTGPAAVEEIEALRRRRYKATGLLTADPEVIRRMDGQNLGLTQVRLTKDGIHKKSPVADDAQFGRLFQHLERVVRRCAAQLLHGDVAVAPYKLSGASPCGTCDLRSVCQFDPAVEGQGHRQLEVLKGPDLWQLLLTDGGEGDE